MIGIQYPAFLIFFVICFPVLQKVQLPDVAGQSAAASCLIVEPPANRGKRRFFISSCAFWDQLEQHRNLLVYQKNLEKVNHLNMIVVKDRYSAYISFFALSLFSPKTSCTSYICFMP